MRKLLIIYVNRITLKIKTGYYLELLTPETMKLLESTKSKITKDKNGETVSHLEITEVVLIHCNIVNNDYQQDSRVLYTSVPFVLVYIWSIIRCFTQKTSMLKSSLCDYSDAYIIASEIITVSELTAGRGNNGIEAVFKSCAPFTDCISEINNTQIDNAIDIDVVMPMYNIIEYSNKNSTTPGSLWQFYRDESDLTDGGALDNFPANSALFKFKQKITG